jgi:hypothetical protein
VPVRLQWKTLEPACYDFSSPIDTSLETARTFWTLAPQYKLIVPTESGHPQNFAGRDLPGQWMYQGRPDW